MTNPYLSIIIPAHNEEERLQITLPKVIDYVQNSPHEIEVLVVENGSADRTSEVVRDFAAQWPFLHLMEVETRGKGLAVKAGMLAARGELRFMCDADLAMPIEDLDRFLSCIDEQEIVIATREGPGATRIGEPAHRHFIGRINNSIIRLMILDGFDDTQAGFKLFRAAAAEDIFAHQRTTGIGFDIEVLYIAKQRGYRVRQVGITWYHDPDSRIRVVADSIQLFKEILLIRRLGKQGAYEQAP